MLLLYYSISFYYEVDHLLKSKEHKSMNELFIFLSMFFGLAISQYLHILYFNSSYYISAFEGWDELIPAGFLWISFYINFIPLFCSIFPINKKNYKKDRKFTTGIIEFLKVLIPGVVIIVVKFIVQSYMFN